jgi:putative transposase
VSLAKAVAEQINYEIRIVCLTGTRLYKHQKDDTEVISKLEVLAKELPTRGFDDYFGRIRNEGYRWNHKRVRRVYRLMKLNIRRRHKRRVPTGVKEPLTVPSGLHFCWSADFMSDALVYGRKVCILNVIDDYNREILAVEADFSMPAERVIAIMDQIVACSKTWKNCGCWPTNGWMIATAITLILP